jgi:hypothetical protein
MAMSDALDDLADILGDESWTSRFGLELAVLIQEPLAESQRWTPLWGGQTPFSSLNPCAVTPPGRFRSFPMEGPLFIP